MADMDYREEIAETYFHWRIRDDAVFAEQERTIKKICYSFADDILRTVIAKGKVCDWCNGSTWLRFTKKKCPACKGTGKLKGKTIDDAIKGYIGYYSQEG